jgi:arsenate reductase
MIEQLVNYDRIRRMIVIYHNPRCSKSRQTLRLLQENGVEPEVVEYLKTPPNPKELKTILKKLSIAPRDLLRTKEEAYKTTGLQNKSLGDDEVIEIMCANPVLIERPIVITDEQAAIGRPPENVLQIL